MSDQVLIPFSNDFPLVPATDTPHVLSTILSHKMSDRLEMPTASASWTLARAEKNYSQIIREVTAMYWVYIIFFSIVMEDHLL